jgi:hypothetical protein
LPHPRTRGRRHDGAHTRGARASLRPGTKHGSSISSVTSDNRFGSCRRKCVRHDGTLPRRT